jgi:DNA invertase Pin-like site-specific DNA recombinase
MRSLAAGTTPGTAAMPVRVVIIGRISTPHQNEENIEASYRYVEDFLRKQHLGPMKIKHLGERASGMLAERQTIRQVEDLIAAGQVDLVVAEDLSRIFRNPRHQFNFVQDAVDAGVRILCLADNLDTATENWELMLGAAGLRHGLVVSDTRRRVRRTATHSFHGGGMVMKVLFGYRKLTKEEALSGEFGPRGLRLAKDPACTPIIRQMREMVLAGKPFVSVAQWLNGQGIRPGPYVKLGRWSARLVAGFLRAPLLHGERTFRNVMHQPILRTGKHRREPNPNPERQTHAELAHFTSEEHDELLRVIEARAATRRRRRGADHPRYRLPRSNAIWPAQHLLCQICGGLMYCYDKDQLKCSNSFGRGEKSCWNHVQISGERVRRIVLQGLLDLAEPMPRARDMMLDSCWDVMSKSSTTAGTALSEIDREINVLEQQADRLAKAIGEGGELTALIKRLKDLQTAIKAATACRHTLRSECDKEVRSLDRKTFRADPLPALLELARKSYEFGALLNEFIPEAKVVPVQDLLHGQVRPRIRVKVALLTAAKMSEAQSRITLHSGVFDVFDQPEHIRHLPRIRNFRQEQPGASYTQIAVAIGIGKMTVKRAMHYLKLMEQHGVCDPYVELTSKPVRASRWKHRDDGCHESRLSDARLDDRS